MNTIAQTNPDSYPPNWNHPDGYSPSAAAPVAAENQWKLQVLRPCVIEGARCYPGSFLDTIPADFLPMISCEQLQWVPPSVWNAA